jgi:hypothetical protein
MERPQNIQVKENGDAAEYFPVKKKGEATEYTGKKEWKDHRIYR